MHEKLSDEIIQFFRRQNFVIISTIDACGSVHNSCKGILKIDRNGYVHLLDLYMGRTYTNLQRNSHVTITAVDEHKFIGYCLKGRARIVHYGKIEAMAIAAWEEKISGRIAQRLLKNFRGEKGHPRHPESLLPRPQYMIVMRIKAVINLTPYHINK